MTGPQSSRSVTRTAALAVGDALLLVLTVLVGLRWDGIQDVDGAVSRASVDLATDSAWTLSITRALTHLGDPLVVSVATVLLGVMLLAVRAYRTAAYLAAVRLAVVVVTSALKQAVARARPHPLHPLAAAHGFSFPSGHASGSAALWCSVALVIATKAPRSVVVAVALVVPVVVATSRVVLGVHYLTDVVAGLVLGLETAVGLALARPWRLPARVASRPRE